MREQMFKMKLQRLTNMGNWETEKQGNIYSMYSVQYKQYVQCTVHVSETFTVRALFSQCPSFFEVGSIQALKE